MKLKSSVISYRDVTGVVFSAPFEVIFEKRDQLLREGRVTCRGGGGCASTTICGQSHAEAARTMAEVHCQQVAKLLQAPRQVAKIFKSRKISEDWVLK
jgi:hypothetical protein